MLWHFRQLLGDFIKNPRKLPMVYRKRIPNLAGDRDVEWAWVAANIDNDQEKVLDIGNGGSNLALVAAMRGANVLAIDINEIEWMFRHPSVVFERKDLFQLTKENKYDVIICCSVLEHIGIPDRYNIDVKNDVADISAMKMIRSLLRPEGRLIITVPVGLDATYFPMGRVYGKARLPILLSDFHVVRESFWKKERDNIWQITSKECALSEMSYVNTPIPTSNYYALGCFVLTH